MYDIRNMNIWKEEEKQNQSTAYLEDDIAELGLSVRSYNCLKRAGCGTVGEIVHLLETDENGLRKIRNLGSRSEAEIRERVKEYCGAPRAGGMSGHPHGKVKTTVIKPARKIWDTDISEYHLSDYAYKRLSACGIRKVRDLYATDPKHEPPWYAVRELFEKLPSAR